MNDQKTDLLVDVDIEPTPVQSVELNKDAKNVKTSLQQQTICDLSLEGAVGGLSDIEVSNEAQFKSYQNQTAEDIESGRARMDSVTSYDREAQKKPYWHQIPYLFPIQIVIQQRPDYQLHQEE